LEAKSLPGHKALAMVTAIVLLFSWIILFTSVWLLFGQWEFPLAQYSPYLTGLSIVCSEACLFWLFKKAAIKQHDSKAQSWFIGMLLAGAIGMILLVMTLA
jgi:hypothetical protein